MRHLATAGVDLNEAAWHAMWGEGRAMSPELAIAYALEGMDQTVERR